MCSWDLNISKDGNSTTLMSNLFQWVTTLIVKEFFHMLKWNYLCFSVCVTGRYWEEFGSVVFTSTIRYLYIWTRFSWAFSLGWAVPALSAFSQITMFQSPNFCGPSLDSFQYVQVSFILRSPALDPALQLCLTRAE